MRARVAIGGIAVLLLAVVVAYQAVFAWDQISHDGFLYSLPAQNKVLIFASLVISATALMLVCTPSGRRATLVGFGALGVLTFAGTTILSRNAWAALLAALVLAASWRVGAWLLAAARVTLPSVAARALIAMALGFSVIATVIYIEGISIGITWFLTTLPVALLGVVGVVDLVRRSPLRRYSGIRAAWHGLLGVGRVEMLALTIAIMALGAISIWTAAPDVMYDPNWGKAWLPAAWADSGQIAAYRFDAQTFAGGSALYVATVGHLADADAIGRYVEFLLGMLLAGFGWRISRPVAGPSIAALLGLVFLVTPHIVWQMGTADDDLLLCLLAAALALAVVGLRPFTWRAALVVGVLAGGAINGKLHLLVFAVLAAVGWWALAPLRAKAGGAIAIVVAAIAIAGPQFLERWADVGNPLFPGLNNVFRSSWWPPVNEVFNLPYGPPSTLADALRLPWTVVTEPTRYMEAVPRGVFGLLPVLLLVFLATGWWQGPWARRLVWLATLVALIAWWVQLRYFRYLLPYAFVSLLFMASPIGALREWVSARLRHGRVALGAVAVAVVAITCAGTATATFFNIAERVPTKVATGREDTHAYLLRNMSGVATVDAINANTPPGARIAVDPGLIYQRVLLEDGRYLMPSWELLGLLNWFAQSGQLGTGATDLAGWRALGVGWIAVGVDALKNNTYATPLATVIRRDGVLVWTDGVTALYRVRGT